MPPKRYVVRAYVTLTEVQDGQRAPPPSDDEDGGPPPNKDCQARRLRRRLARELRRQQEQKQQPRQPQPQHQQQARLVVLGEQPGPALQELRLRARLPPNTTATRLVTRLMLAVARMVVLY